MKKLLCPVDGSRAADNAIVYAAKLAQKIGASLELFNVQVLAELTPVDAVLGKGFNVNAAAESLEEKALEVRKVFKIDCEAKVSTGLFSLTGAIKQEAVDFDLVIMGTEGEDDLNKRIFGSHTYKLIRSTAVPVLLVPYGCGYTEITRIAYAFDYRNEKETPLTPVVRFAKILSSELCVVQIMEQHFTRHAEMQLERIQNQLQQLYAGELKISFDALYAYSPAEGINAFMSAGRADILALCSHNSSMVSGLFDRTVTHAISKQATYPVFIFHKL